MSPAPGTAAHRARPATKPTAATPAAATPAAATGSGLTLGRPARATRAQADVTNDSLARAAATSTTADTIQVVRCAELAEYRSRTCPRPWRPADCPGARRSRTQRRRPCSWAHPASAGCCASGADRTLLDVMSTTAYLLLLMPLPSSWSAPTGAGRVTVGTTVISRYLPQPGDGAAVYRGLRSRHGSGFARGSAAGSGSRTPRDCRGHQNRHARASGRHCWWRARPGLARAGIPQEGGAARNARDCRQVQILWGRTLMRSRCRSADYSEHGTHPPNGLAAGANQRPPVDGRDRSDERRQPV